MDNEKEGVFRKYLNILIDIWILVSNYGNERDYDIEETQSSKYCKTFRDCDIQT